MVFVTVLARKLEADPDIQVGGRAMDGLDGLEQGARLKPDVITLAVELDQLGIEPSPIPVANA